MGGDTYYGLKLGMVVMLTPTDYIMNNTSMEIYENSNRNKNYTPETMLEEFAASK